MSSRAHELDCERLEDCAAYVLGALEAPEVQVLRAHLAECPACRAEVAQLQLVADLLAIGVPRAAVPESLHARVVGPAHAEAERRAGARRDAAGREVGVAPARARGAGGGSILRRLVPALAGALAVGVGLLIGALAFKGEPSEKN